MLERGQRSLPEHLVSTVLRTYEISPNGLPFQGAATWSRLRSRDIAAQLAGLGYPGFSYMNRRAKWNPAELLVAALTHDDLERRTAEALPWLALIYSDMDWEWVIRESKLHDAQNRLGFVITLARETAELKDDLEVAERLRSVELRLKPSLLARIGTYCDERMSRAEREWLKTNSTPQARQWNLLSDLKPEDLTHAA